MSKRNIIQSWRIWISYLASPKLSLLWPSLMLFFLFLLHLIPHTSNLGTIDSNVIENDWPPRCSLYQRHPKWVEITSDLRQCAWEHQHQTFMLRWMRILWKFDWVIHLWIGWILAGNKNPGEPSGKQCWTLGAFIPSCKRRFLLGHVKRDTHTEMGSCVNKSVWFLFHLQSCLPTLLSRLYLGFELSGFRQEALWFASSNTDTAIMCHPETCLH